MEQLSENELVGLERSRWAVHQRAAAEIRAWRKQDAEFKAGAKAIAFPDETKGTLPDVVPKPKAGSPLKFRPKASSTNTDWPKLP